MKKPSTVKKTRAGSLKAEAGAMPQVTTDGADALTLERERVERLRAVIQSRAPLDSLKPGDL